MVNVDIEITGRKISSLENGKWKQNRVKEKNNHQILFAKVIAVFSKSDNSRNNMEDCMLETLDLYVLVNEWDRTRVMK